MGEARFDDLTAREREVLRSLLRKHLVKRVGVDLGISRGTVAAHLEKAREKLGVSSSLVAAEMLAEFEHRSNEPSPVSPMPPGGVSFDYPDAADVESIHGVRDVAAPAWIGEAEEVSRETLGGSTNWTAALKEALGIAVAGTALLAILLYAARKLPEVAPWNVFDF